MNQPIVIGIDHGYAAMKTAHCTFHSGLTAYDHEPYTQQNVLEMDGKYYVVGSSRGGLQKDKTATQDYYLLTLTAIAKELQFRGLDSTATVHIAAGLPLTSFGRDKVSFKQYLLRDEKPVFYRYEGVDYAITICAVSLFPQGYSAILTQSGLLDEPSVIVADIGGWTVDLMRLDNRIPNATTCRSLELGMISCLDEIAEQVRRNLGLSLTSAQMEYALRGEHGSLDQKTVVQIEQQANQYIQKLLSAIAESGLDVKAMPIVFLGGGANLLKRHLPHLSGLCRPIILDDMTLNAKGYERLVAKLLERDGHGQ